MVSFLISINNLIFLNWQLSTMMYPNTVMASSPCLSQHINTYGEDITLFQNVYAFLRLSLPKYNGF